MSNRPEALSNQPSGLRIQSVEEQRLEQQVATALRDLPMRRAPAALESRVLDELKHRAARSWWRRSFRDWPPLARAAFVAACGPLVGVGLFGGRWMSQATQSLSRSSLLPFAAARQAAGFVQGAEDFAVLLANAVSPVWLYAGLAAGALLYGLLFGLGAAAYRTLYLQPFDFSATSRGRGS